MPRIHALRKWAVVLLLLSSGLSTGTFPAQQRPVSVSGGSIVDQPLKTSVKNPQAIAVVVSIQDYQDKDRGMPSVDFAVHDADAVRGVLTNTLGYTDDADHILFRTNSQVTGTRFRLLIQRDLANRVVPGQSDVFFYYSGHGAPNVSTKEPYLLPWDFDVNGEPSAANAYALKDLYADLAGLRAKSVTVVLDACFSGRIDSGATLTRDASALVIVNESPASALMMSNGVVIAAGGRHEVATWYPAERHGLMTYYWLRGMRGEAADADGRVTARGLESYLREKVPPDARRLRDRPQTPEVQAADPNRVLAMLPVSAVRAGAATIDRTYGSLRVTLIEGGELYLDGVHQGTIPAGAAFTQPRIESGPHPLEVRKDGYETHSRTIVVEPDKQTSETVRLAAILPDRPQVQQLYGLIEVIVDRGGTLSIDGKTEKELGAYAPYTTAKITAGPHQVRVEKPGFVTVDQEVMVPPNQTAPVALTLRAAPANVPAASPAAAAPAPRSADRPSPMPGVAMEFVRIQPGTFTRGCSAGDNQCLDAEKPAHQVRIAKSFEMGKYEVTQEQWQAVMGTNPSYFRGDARPVEDVSWNDAEDFLNRMNARNDGYRYRLPTEAEWEYTARAGTQGPYPGTLDAMGWYDGNSGKQTHPVGQKQANAWGLYDMNGNVWEWVQDGYASYSRATQTDPNGPSSGTARIQRGGSWYDSSWNARVSHRVSYEPSGRYSSVGFRCVREALP